MILTLRMGICCFKIWHVGFLCEAIESVTPGYHNVDITHIGIYGKDGDQDFVIEAVPPEVTVTPLVEFLSRAKDDFERPSVFVGSLRSEYHRLIPAVIEKALELQGLPYDRFYLSGDDAYYCIELVVDAFRYANDDEEFFPEQPMSFINRNTGVVHENWKKYYKRLGMELPVGELGSMDLCVRRRNCLAAESTKPKGDGFH